MEITLFAHQQRLVDRFPKRCLIAHETGTGKTITCISLANKVGCEALFIAPKGLVRNWEINLEKFCKVPWKVVSKEAFRRDFKDIKRYNTVIWDEAHYIAGSKSQMSKNFYKYLRAHKVEHIYLATATPYLSSPWNIYQLAKHLGYQWNWMKFQNKFFMDVYRGRSVFKEPIPGIEDDMAILVSKIGDIVRMKDCVDVPEQRFETEYFSLTEKQRAEIQFLQDPNPMVRFTKAHQIENGTLKGDEYNEAKHYDNHKQERLVELMEQNNKIIIVCRYNLQINRLAELARKITDKVFVLNGESKDRHEIVEQAEREDRAIILINAMVSEGYQLPSFPLMVFASMDFSYKNYKQLLGRILRIDKLKKNVYLHLVCDGVDTAVYNAIMSKADFDLAIYARSLMPNVEMPEDFSYGLSREKLSDGFGTMDFESL